MNKNTHGSTFKLQYTPALDGLRGLSILGVMIFHAEAFHLDTSFLKGGFIGVDIFLILSGFLITILLINELELTGQFNFIKFITRRILRLIPALVIFLCTYAMLAFWILERGKGLIILQNIGIVLLYLTNWAFAYDWVMPPSLAPTWSLATEAQFYLCWPLILFGLLTRSTRKFRIVFYLLGVIVGAWLLRVYLLAHGERHYAYYSLFTRIDELAIGCILGIVISSDAIYKIANKFSLLIRFIAPISMMGLVYIFFMVEQSIQTYLWLACVVEVLVIIVILNILLEEEGVISVAMSNLGLVWIGKISYGLYLWHRLIYCVVDYLELSKLSTIILYGILPFIIATISFYWIEKPFLNLKKKLSLL